MLTDGLASLRARARARERAALVKLADQLRALVLATNKPKPPPAAAPEHEYEPQLPKAAQTDPPPPPSKKKPKKKKRATLANEGNPHHVDKCACTQRTNDVAYSTRPALAPSAAGGPVLRVA